MNNKKLALFLMIPLTITAGDEPYFEAAGVKAAREFNKGTAANILLTSEQIQVVIAAGTAKIGAAAYTAGYTGAYGTLAGAAAAAKAGVIIAAPWAAGGVALGGGSYLLYRRYYPYVPTEKEQLVESRYEFRKCLRTNAQGAMNREGFPAQCADHARNFATVAGDVGTQEMIAAFKKYNCND